MQEAYTDIITTSASTGASNSQPSGFSPSGTSVNRSGGVLEYNVGADTNSGAGNYRSPSNQYYNEDVTTHHTGQGTNSQQVRTVSASELTAGNTGVLSSARNGFGNPAMGNITADTVVDYQGMSMTVGSLEAIGIVRRTATGYEEVGNVPQQQAPQQGQPEAQPQSNLPAGTELFEPAQENYLAQIIDPIPQGAYDSAIAQVLARGVDGINNLSDLAYNSGMSPAQFKQTMGTVAQMFQAQADNTAKALGFPEPAALWAWAKQNRPAQLEAAQRSLAFGRNTSEIRNLAKEYRANATYTPAQLSQAGWKVQASASGETLIQVRTGAWMTTQAATRAGLM